MAKFNVEVELDWVDEEAGYTIDEEFKKIVWDAIKNNKVKYHRGRRR